MNLKKSFTALLLTAAVVLLSSCATTLRVKVKRPAELDMHGANTIAVLQFQPVGGQRFNKRGMSVRDVLRMFDPYEKNMNRDEREICQILTDELRFNLAKSEDLQLVDDRTISEALRSGRKVPVDAYLTGYIYKFDNHVDKHEITSKDDDGNKIVKIKWERNVSVTIRYEIIDARTNEIITFRKQDFRKSSGYYDDKWSIPEAYDLLQRDIESLAHRILKEVQPYYETVSLTLRGEKDDPEELKIANEHAKNGLIEEATKEYETYYNKTGNTTAGYNAALLYQAQGELYEAEYIMKEIAKDGDKGAVRALKSIRYEIEQAEILQKQMDAQEE